MTGTRWLMIVLALFAAAGLAACTGKPAQLQSVEVESSSPDGDEMGRVGG